jgi:2'-5' RNA ligase
LDDLSLKLRSFIAIRVNPEVHRAIDDMVEELRGPRDGVRWVSSANLHLTLKFLGPAVPLEKIQMITRELDVIATKTAPFGVDVSGVGGFPNLRHPRVLWVGLHSEALIELASEVESAAHRCGFPGEDRAFTAHLTIARINVSRVAAETRARLEGVADRVFGSSTIREMTLYRSRLSPKGSDYEALKVFPFIA